MGESHFATWPVAIYGIVLVMAAIAYFILTLVLVAEHGKESIIATALGRDFKGKVSIVIYLVGIFLTPWVPALAVAIYAFVALMWLVPDRRIEKALKQQN